MDEQTRTQIAIQLAQRLRERRLDGVARLLLDATEPMALFASQFALFARPFTPRSQWQVYLDALSEEEGWKALKRSINEQEC